MQIRTEGPIFDGRADTALAKFCEAAEEDIADEGHSMVRDAFHETFRNPTGYYESHVTVRKEQGATVVTDNGVVYGPWLEGEGSRNNTTRFKGYANFRRTTQALRTKATGIAEKTLARYIERVR